MGNKVKKTVLAAMVGSVVGFGGCLEGWWGQLLTYGAVYTGMEYVLDNDGIYDLFEDGTVPQ